MIWELDLVTTFRQAGSTTQWFNQPGVLSSSSLSDSTLRFFDLGEGGSVRLESVLQGVAMFHDSYRMEENSRLRLSEVQR